MSSGQDTEITLGAGKLLGLFFALAAVCGLFFGLGFMLGKSSAPVNPNASLVETAAPTATTTPGDKPSPAKAEIKPPSSDCPQGQNCAPSPELSFYKADEQHTPSSAAAVTPASEPKQVAEMVAKPIPPGSGYLVQIAAVSKQQDAEALVGALRKKSYPVFITNPGDALYHVQIGPFADVKEAESMRTRLQGDGYNPILKR